MKNYLRASKTCQESNFNIFWHFFFFLLFCKKSFNILIEYIKENAVRVGKIRGICPAFFSEFLSQRVTQYKIIQRKGTT